MIEVIFLFLLLAGYLVGIVLLAFFVLIVWAGKDVWQ